MNIESIQSGHWTDEELLATLYGVGPSGNHLEGCWECQSRLAAMQLHRASIEQDASAEEAVKVSFLAAQRRAIYQRLEQPLPWWNALAVRRWAAGLASACVLCGSLVFYQHQQAAQLAQDRINDARLAQEVALLAQDSDTGVTAMAPLEGLFE